MPRAEPCTARGWRASARKQRWRLRQELARMRREEETPPEEAVEIEVAVAPEAQILFTPAGEQEPIDIGRLTELSLKLLADKTPKVTGYIVHPEHYIALELLRARGRVLRRHPARLTDSEARDAAGSQSPPDAQ